MGGKGKAQEIPRQCIWHGTCHPLAGLITSDGVKRPKGQAFAATCAAGAVLSCGELLRAGKQSQSRARNNKNMKKGLQPDTHP